MSLENVCVFNFFLFLSAFTGASDGYLYSRLSKCFFNSDLSEMEYIDSYIFNKDVYIQFNSTVGHYVGYTEHGIYNAERWNNDTAFLESERAELERFCKSNAEKLEPAIIEKTVKPQVKINLVKQAGGRHPAVLVCSAYDFYPKWIKVTWMRNGKPVTSDVTSTEELMDGDWFYQIHSHLEYTPESGEKISCVVDHASSNQPLILNWDSSLPESERIKIAIGTSFLVLGILLTGAAGFLYYKKKSSGRTLVPH